MKTVEKEAEKKGSWFIQSLVIRSSAIRQSRSGIPSGKECDRECGGHDTGHGI